MARTKKKVEEAVDVVEVAEKPVKKAKKGAYHLFIDLNDKSYEVDTDNLEEAIASFRPEILKTSLTIRVTKDGKTLDRYLYLNPARRLFNNSIALEAFVRNLLF